MQIGDKSVITFENAYLDRTTPANDLIMLNCITAGVRSSSISSVTDGGQFGRTWISTTPARTSTGRGNEFDTGDTSAALINDTLLRRCSWVQATEVKEVLISGLSAGSTYTIGASTSYNVASATLKLSDGVGSIEITETRGLVLGNVPEAYDTFTATAGGLITLDLESIDQLGIGIVAGMSIERIT